MLKPGGGFFKKLFSPNKMAATQQKNRQPIQKPQTPSAAPRNAPARMGGSIFGRAMTRGK